jgi:hypothetical protein
MSLGGQGCAAGDQREVPALPAHLSAQTRSSSDGCCGLGVFGATPERARIGATWIQLEHPGVQLFRRAARGREAVEVAEIDGRLRQDRRGLLARRIDSPKVLTAR